MPSWQKPPSVVMDLSHSSHPPPMTGKITVIFSGISAQGEFVDPDNPHPSITVITHPTTESLGPAFRHIEILFMKKKGSLAFKYKDQWLEDSHTPVQLGMESGDTIHHVEFLKILVVQQNTVSQFFTLIPDASVKLSALFKSYATAVNTQPALLQFTLNKACLHGENSIVEVVRNISPANLGQLTPGLDGEDGFVIIAHPIPSISSSSSETEISLDLDASSDAAHSSWTESESTTLFADSIFSARLEPPVLVSAPESTLGTPTPPVNSQHLEKPLPQNDPPLHTPFEYEPSPPVSENPAFETDTELAFVLLPTPENPDPEPVSVLLPALENSQLETEPEPASVVLSSPENQPSENEPELAPIFLARLKTSLFGADAKWVGNLIYFWPEPYVVQDDEVILRDFAAQVVKWRDAVVGWLIAHSDIDTDQEPSAVDSQLAYIHALEDLHRDWRAEALQRWSTFHNHSPSRSPPDSAAKYKTTSLQRAIRTNASKRLLREARMVKILGMVVAGWKRRLLTSDVPLEKDWDLADLLPECSKGAVDGWTFKDILRGARDGLGDDADADADPLDCIGIVSADDRETPGSVSVQVRFLREPGGSDASRAPATRRRTSSLRLQVNPAVSPSSHKPKGQRVPCPRPGCVKTYKNTGGLHHHLTRGTCVYELDAATVSEARPGKLQDIPGDKMVEPLDNHEEAAETGAHASAMVGGAHEISLGAKLRRSSARRSVPRPAAASATSIPTPSSPAHPREANHLTCPRLGCIKTYKAANGLKYHLANGTCVYATGTELQDGTDDSVVTQSHALAGPGDDEDSDASVLPRAEKGTGRRIQCPRPGCTKKYKSPFGLQYHLSQGTCVFQPGNSTTNGSAGAGAMDVDGEPQLVVVNLSSAESGDMADTVVEQLGPRSTRLNDQQRKAHQVTLRLLPRKRKESPLEGGEDSSVDRLEDGRRSTRLKDRGTPVYQFGLRPQKKTREVEPESTSTAVSAAKDSGAELPPLKRRKTLPSQPVPNPPTMIRREKIQHEWNKIARAAGAAGIEFVNDIDGEELPPGIGVLFPYVERTYIFDAGVPEPSAPTGCQCDSRVGCTHLEQCSCQGNIGENPAYDSQGFFTFETYQEIVECNHMCSCPPKCSNRVAQYPRQIPIQIFKTAGRGWGVRVPVDLVRGRVLGLYTGLLIRRKEADKLSGSRASYCFDLDINEAPDEEPPENAYSVDAYGCGNWSRFANHSCSPNLQIISVVYDSTPEDNMPYLALVATKDIPAYTELTFDYNPAHQTEFELKRYREKANTKKNSKNRTRCLCGANNCRGWLSVVA